MSDENWKPVADELSRILKTVSADSRPSRFSRWLGWLNSAFVVTVLGGFALAYLAQRWQQQTMTRERTVADLHARQQAFYDCLTQFPLSTWILRDLTSRELWIRYQLTAPSLAMLAPNGKYYDGQGLDTVPEVIERLRREYRESGDLIAMCEKLRGVCKHDSTKLKLVSLAKLVREARDVDGSLYLLPVDADNFETLIAKLKAQLKTATDSFRTIEASFSEIVSECSEEL